jgi:muconate cycloisomerase
MKIQNIEVHLLESPIKMKRSQGVGSIQASIKRVVVRVRADQGIDGIGEGQAWEVFSGTNENLFHGIAQYLRPVLLGTDPRDIPQRMADCDRALVGSPEAKAAVEMALFDLCGKAANLPLYSLIGGKVRDRIPFSFSIANPDIDADIELAKQMLGAGHRIFKVKTGFASHAEDMRRLSLLREHLGFEFDLRIDYNQGLQPYNALQQLRDVEQFKPTFIEQPVPRDAIAAMAQIAAALDTPIMADESVFSPAEALRTVQERAADIISIKLMKAGGIGKAMKVNAIAEAAGLPCYGGTLWEGGVALAAASHFIAASANVSLGCEFYMPKYVFQEDILVRMTPAEAGHVHVPSGPGIGVDIDWKIVEKQRIAFSA